jgi:hypothetical protein
MALFVGNADYGFVGLMTAFLPNEHALFYIQHET